MRKQVGVIGCLVILVAGCSAKEPDLITFRASNDGDGPDEFAILPSKPLQTPESFAELPAPTPGGSNLTDPTPEADMVAALGGNPAVLARASTDGGLLNYAGRYGVAQGIRGQLAAADLRFRQQNPGLPLERLFNVTTYFDAYSDQALDQYLELERFRRAGIRTPAAPPLPVDDE
ncbi:DUF3035 domain-containing protein [Ovoidimarina sediminis]|uniref:DUF3035 domain-containing protein n=1 Tax=Ovoidimarina sediminis TaxID=3079856 RepID=UPI0029123BF7|nr:DUF3035 domain-containing protein [Rhodophyticola sp. MJ-SS7]MDU8943836.1 DUF3035 domain-containing protein [Rhodophyticola sp. MJ-SS7]